MKCPNCQVDLVMSERQDVEIDYCPKCRGVWLDRGELDKIIEKSAAAEQAPVAPQQVRSAPPPRDDHYRSGEYGEHGGHGERGYYKGRRRKSMLAEIFDF